MSAESLTPGPSPVLGRGVQGWLAPVIYIGLSVLAGSAFLLATLFGDYDWGARIGGAIWVFGLCVTILMPTVTPWVRKRMSR